MLFRSVSFSSRQKFRCSRRSGWAAQNRPIGPETAKEPLMARAMPLRKAAVNNGYGHPDGRIMSEKKRDEARRCQEQTIRGRYRPRLCAASHRPDKSQPATVSSPWEDRGTRAVHSGFMPKKMLIDATHAEETRVVVVDGNKVEEFDFESENKRQLAGNIYLAKVTRVEPSLQAAFVDYGGNRHGFLAFSEIHPDYYQIPIADRQALLEEERAFAEAQAAKDEEDQKDRKSTRLNSSH